LKLSDIRTIEAAKTNLLVLSLFTFIIVMIAPLASAQSAPFSLNSDVSTASFYQGSRMNPESVNTGVARVMARVNLNPHDLGNSIVDLNIYPADENWGSALNAEGVLPTGFVPDATDHTLLTFNSERIQKTSDDKLQVTGNLTVTKVERSYTLTPSEAYAGPVYGDPVIHTSTLEITFLFRDPSALPTAKSSVSTMEVLGSAAVGQEDLPELLNAIQQTNWPSVVRNEECQNPSTIGEDYSGAQCTGTLIEATRHDNCQMSTSTGEDYSGPICALAAGNQTTIVLDLKLLPNHSESASTTAQAIGKDWR
jgi:polyisoprenoid-binding protein YceI